MTEFVDVPGGRIADDENGSGPLVVLSHGIGDHRQVYRFLTPKLAQAGYRVANADLRGHGQSSMGWASITRTDVAGDLLALIDHLGGPAVIVGHSISGGAATIAAVQAPDLVSAVVAAMPAGIGTVAMVGGGGHYIHAQSPDEVAALIIPFLKEHAGA